MVIAIVGLYLLATLVFGAVFSTRGLKVLGDLQQQELPTLVARNPHNLIRSIVVANILTCAELVLHSSLARNVYGGECWFEGSCVDYCPVPGAITLNSLLFNRVRWKEA